MVELLFEDIFTLTRIDPDGKKFDKGSPIDSQFSSRSLCLTLSIDALSNDEQFLFC